ncbi:MAG: HIT family protein [Thiovulaceae bacterium]|nr:HIT family protein [Sulfurimonadaceae bacterium]
MQKPIFETDELYIEIEESEIPWLKIFTKKPFKELSELPKALRLEIFDLLDSIEKQMLAFYKPEKINIASFGNYMPQVHMHIMARFKEDSYFPEPMWGQKQREGNIDKRIDAFVQSLLTRLEA